MFKTGIRSPRRVELIQGSFKRAKKLTRHRHHLGIRSLGVMSLLNGTILANSPQVWDDCSAGTDQRIRTFTGD